MLTSIRPALVAVLMCYWHAGRSMIASSCDSLSQNPTELCQLACGNMPWPAWHNPQVAPSYSRRIVTHLRRAASSKTYMALINCLQSLPAPQRVAPPIHSGSPSHYILPQASFSSIYSKEFTSRKSAERIRSPRRHLCRSAISDPWATSSSETSSSMDAVGVVIVDHGSKRAEANEMLEEFASMYRLVF